MTRHVALRWRPPANPAEPPWSPPPQDAVDAALNAFVSAAEENDAEEMRSALRIVETATEQQVQCAMLHVQRSRQISRGALLSVLAG
jgi:hypothetical protein